MKAHRSAGFDRRRALIIARSPKAHFASQEAGTKGPRTVYEKIRLAVDELGVRAAAVPLSIVGVLDADADPVRLLKIAVRTGPGVSRIRFSKNVINGHFIDDALIYRVA